MLNPSMGSGTGSGIELVGCGFNVVDGMQ